MAKLVGVVILNYKSYWETEECVESALAQKYPDVEIIIVENGSGNESYEVLQKKYGGREHITLLESKENLGFARGNNLGIRYAREVLKCDYVFVVNSDIVFEPDLFEQITAVDITGVGVLDPAVYSLDGERIQPSGNTNNMYRKFFRTVFDILVTSITLIPWINRIYRRIRKKTDLSEVEEKTANTTEENVVEKKEKQSVLPEWKYTINGCAFFLTEHFFEYYTQIYPKTFLYWEEINTLMYLQKAGLISKEVETSPVIHKEGRSTRAKGEKVDMRKVLKQSRDSMKKSWFMYFMPYKLIRKKYN